MDDYRKNVIQMVRNHVHKDYKNKEQRKQVWEDIDTKNPPPTGTGATAKATWDQLARGFCNALKRKDKKSGRGATNYKEWKFLQEMMFLVPVKKSRVTTGSMDAIVHSDEDSNSSYRDDTQAEDDEQQVTSVIGVTDGITVEEQTTKEVRAQLYVSPTPLKRLNQKRVETGKDEDELIKLLRQRQEHKNTESNRLHFFRSIMPKVDYLTDDEFLDFQVDVLQVLSCHISGSSTVSPFALNVQL